MKKPRRTVDTGSTTLNGDDVLRADALIGPCLDTSTPRKVWPWILLAALAAPTTCAAGVFPYEVHSKTLDNGLTIHVVPMQSPGVVAYQTWMKVGSRDETEAGRTGFAHFFEHLMFYGTETLDHEEREREILKLGADENAWTWFDDTVYHQVLATSQLERLIEIEADRFENLHLTADYVKKESGAVYGEFRKGQASPDGRVWELLYETAFDTHTYTHDTIGYEADIAAMPDAIDHATDFFDRYYRPENAVIVVVGDIEPEPTFKLIETHYGDWEPATKPRNTVPEEPEQLTTKEAELTWPTPTAPRLAMGWKAPAEDPDSAEVASLQLVADLLGSKVGPLHKRLIKEEALAYDLYVARDDLVDPGLFKVIVEIKEAGDVDTVHAIVDEEIAALQASVDPDVLDRTRSHAKYGFLSSLDDPAAVANALGWSNRRGGGPDALVRFYAGYDAAEPEDVSAAARKYLVPSGLTVVWLTADDDDDAPTEEVPAEEAPADGGGE